MTLTTARPVPRPFAASDAAFRAGPEVAAVPPGGPEAAAPWAREAREDGRLLGRLGPRPPPESGGGAELVHMLNSDVRGRGLPTEGGAAATRAAFGPPWPRPVIALARPGNTASVAAMGEFWMRFEDEGLGFGARAVRCAAHAPRPPPEGGRAGSGGACTTC